MTYNDRRDEKLWFVLRDLQRGRASMPHYKTLAEQYRFKVFTPMTWRIVQGERCRVPYLRDLLFTYALRQKLDPIIEKIPTLQYRFVKGGGYLNPMVVPTADMERFIYAVRSTTDVEYYSIDEVRPEMYHKKIRIIGGSLDGYEGVLLETVGTATKRLLVELPGFFAAGVKIGDMRYVTFIE